MRCTHPITGFRFTEDGVPIFAYVSGNSIVLVASEDAHGSYYMYIEMRAANGVIGSHGKPVLECSDCCNCTGISIGYTTQQMSVDEQQNLTVAGAVEGCTYTWGLSGGGSLSASEGTAVTYTAPSSNPGCVNNATISLNVEGGGQCDSLQIAVNADTPGASAYVIKTCFDGMDTCESGCGCFTLWGVAYKCDGTVKNTCGAENPGCLNYGAGFTYPTCAGAKAAVCINNNQAQCSSCAAALAFANASSCNATNFVKTGGSPGGLGTTDIRTTEQIAAGCCPAALL